MSVLDWISVFFCLIGGAFYLAGTVGMIRFPDTFSRLHALTKADNLGLGCIVVGLILQSEALAAAGKLVLIWLLALLGGTTACYLIGRHLLEAEERREKK